MTPHMKWALVAGAVLVAIFLVLAHRSAHKFNAFDILMDPATGKASLNAVLILVMAALAVWLTVDREIHLKDDVVSLITIVLGTFVGGRVIAQGINAFKTTPDSTTVTETVQREIKSTASDPDASKKGTTE